MSDTSEYSLKVNRMTDVELVHEIMRLCELSCGDYDEASPLVEMLEICQKAALKRMNPEVLIR